MNKQHPSIDRLIDYIHRELSPEDDAAILLHVESCDECRALYETEVRLSEALRTHATEAERELPQGVVNAIWAAVEAPPAPTFGERLREFFKPVIAVPLAAAAAIAIYFGVASTHHAGSLPTIDAAYYLDDHAALNSTTPFGEGNAVPSQLEDEQTAGVNVVAVQSTILTADATR